MELKTQLYPYQKEAIEKLLPIRVGALYFEMGTGKTRTTLEMIKYRFEDDKLNQVIWLCPCSVKDNLKKDIIKHCGEFPEFITICGIETLSSSIKENSRLYELSLTKTCMLVVDESNLVKNKNALRTKHITRIAEKCKYRMILNGTPISKTYADLFSQWYLLDWRILGYKSFYTFAANHIVWDERVRGKIDHCVNVDYIVEKIAPYSYQVKKEDILNLPDKYYNSQYCHMTCEQESHYDYVADTMLFSLDEVKPATIYRMFSALQAVISGFKVIFDENKNHYKLAPFFENSMDNPRIETILNLADNITEKTIIYCKFVAEVNTITELLREKFGENKVLTFFGNDSLKTRNEHLRQFENEGLILVATKQCAGYGLNLQFCHNIIYYNNDWNYATRVQSEDRVHRIGQTKDINIIDIVCGGSLDVRIMRSLRRKELMVQDFQDIMKDKNKERLMDWLHGKGLEDEETLSRN